MSVQKEVQTFENPVSEDMERDDDTGQDETAIVKQHQEIGLSDRAKMTAVLQSKIFGFEGVQGEEGEAESGEALLAADLRLLIKALEKEEDIRLPPDYGEPDADASFGIVAARAMIGIGFGKGEC